MFVRGLLYTSISRLYENSRYIKVALFKAINFNLFPKICNKFFTKSYTHFIQNITGQVFQNSTITSMLSVTT